MTPEAKRAIVPASASQHRTTLQRRCACGGTPGPDGECEQCQRKRLALQHRTANALQATAGSASIPGASHATGHMPAAASHAVGTPGASHHFSGVAVGSQSTLLVNQPGDAYEQEADRAAAAIIGPADHRTSTLGAALSAPTAPLRQQHVSDDQTVGRKAPDTARPVGDTATMVNTVLQSGGQPLDTETRAFMESRFGYDFGRVRVHTDHRAAETALAIHALAYTVGHNVVFGTGQYAPRTTEGRHLLAHELMHTLQQGPRGNAPRGMLMGRWDAAVSECSAQPKDKWIQKVVVEQAIPQTVTAYWSDGSTDSDTCSSGKGHCCVDATAPGGAACTEANSHIDGSNCTPITKANGYLVQNRDLDHNGVLKWTEFAPARGIALHEYTPVDGTPLSHGCVRLNPDMALTIFCGARHQQTWVQVHSDARPQCDNSNLQDAWTGDFRMGGLDPAAFDGDRDTQAAIREARRMLNSAFGRVLTVDEINALTVDDIPRCAEPKKKPTKGQAL